MKAFTDLEQSKKLAEILPLESADMTWEQVTHDLTEGFTWEPTIGLDEAIKGNLFSYRNGYILPCWSLAALLGVLPSKCYPIKDHETSLILGKPKDKWCALYWDATGMQDGEQTLADNPVDACYEMILKLHEQNML